MSFKEFIIYWNYWKHNNHRLWLIFRGDPCVWLCDVSSLIKCHCLWSERDRAGQHSHDSVKSWGLEIKAVMQIASNKTASWIRRHVDRHMMCCGFRAGRLVSVTEFSETICLRKWDHTYQFVFFGPSHTERCLHGRIFVFGLLRISVQLQSSQDL